MSIEELNSVKQALGVATDKELAEVLGVSVASINSYRIRGIPQKLRALIAEKKLEKIGNTGILPTINIDFKALVEELKKFYGVSSLEAVAVKMGYSAHSAASWRKKKKISRQALVKWENDKQKQIALPSVPNKKLQVRFFSGINASAGYGIENSEVEYDIIDIDEALLMGSGIRNRKNLDVINVSGDSMLPFFHNGESIIVERDCEATNGNTVIANIAGDLYIKRIEKDPLGNFVRLISTNKEYSTIVLRGQEMEKLHIIGIVRGVFRPL